MHIIQTLTLQQINITVTDFNAKLGTNKL